MKRRILISSLSGPANFTLRNKDRLEIVRRIAFFQNIVEKKMVYLLSRNRFSFIYGGQFQINFHESDHKTQTMFNFNLTRFYQVLKEALKYILY